MTELSQNFRSLVKDCMKTNIRLRLTSVVALLLLANGLAACSKSSTSGSNGINVNNSSTSEANSTTVDESLPMVDSLPLPTSTVPSQMGDISDEFLLTAPLPTDGHCSSVWQAFGITRLTNGELKEVDDALESSIADMRARGVEPSVENPIQLPGGNEWDGSSSWNIGTELVITGDIDSDGLRDAVMRHTCDWGSANSGFIEEPLTLYLSSKKMPSDVDCWSNSQGTYAELTTLISGSAAFVVELATKEESEVVGEFYDYNYDCAIWLNPVTGEVISGLYTGESEGG